MLLHAPQFRNIRRLGSSRARYNHSVHQKKLCLFDFVENIQITSQRMRAMFLFNVSEDFDMFDAKLPAQAQQFARAALDQPRSADVREDVSFHSQKIEVGPGGNFQRRFIRCFQHLDADRSVELPPNCARNSRHKAHSANWQGRFNVRQVVAILQNDGVRSRFHVVAQV
jgi:hypothetical protein